MWIAVLDLLVLFNFLQPISARGKVIDIFNQAGKGDILELRTTSNKIAKDGQMHNALHQYSDRKWQGSGGVYAIPYTISGKYTSEERDIIFEAMDRIHKNTCIRFVPWTNEIDYVDIQNEEDEGCYTSIGRVGGRSILMLEANSQSTCIVKGVVIHELMHVIGLWHEHMRYDRDNYIRVMWENIKPEYRSQFAKVSPEESTTYGIPYDYQSVMHYGKKSFAYEGTMSMVTLDPAYQDVIGQRRDAAPSDFLKICAMYGCTTCMGGSSGGEHSGNYGGYQGYGGYGGYGPWPYGENGGYGGYGGWPDYGYGGYGGWPEGGYGGYEGYGGYGGWPDNGYGWIWGMGSIQQLFRTILTRSN